VIVDSSVLVDVLQYLAASGVDLSSLLAELSQALQQSGVVQKTQVLLSFSLQQ
jgi:hypothetical protein